MSMPNVKKKKLAVYGSYAVILLALFSFQYAAAWHPAPGKATVSFLLPAVFAAGILFKDWAGAFYGLAVGVAMDIVTSDAVCFNAILLFLLGWSAGILIRRLLINNWISALLIILAETFVYYFIKWFCFVLLAGGEAGRYFARITLPTVLFTALAGVPLYFLLRWFARLLFRTVGQ